MTAITAPVLPAVRAGQQIESLLIASESLEEPVHHDLRRPRVLLADDHVDMQQTMADLLAATCDVVGGVSDSIELVGGIERLRPDVVVVDLNMPQYQWH